MDCASLQIPPRAEVPVGPMEHRHAGAVIGIKRKKGGMKRTRRGRINRVAYIGADQRHQRDLAVVTDFN